MIDWLFQMFVLVMVRMGHVWPRSPFPPPGGHPSPEPTPARRCHPSWPVSTTVSGPLPMGESALWSLPGMSHVPQYTCLPSTWLTCPSHPARVVTSRCLEMRYCTCWCRRPHCIQTADSMSPCLWSSLRMVLWSLSLSSSVEQDEESGSRVLRRPALTGHWGLISTAGEVWPQSLPSEKIPWLIMWSLAMKIHQEDTQGKSTLQNHSFYFTSKVWFTWSQMESCENKIGISGIIVLHHCSLTVFTNLLLKSLPKLST